MNTEKSLPFMPSTAHSSLSWGAYPSESKTEDAPAHAFGALDLNKLIIKHPAATFFMRLGPQIAVVDRAVTPSPGDMAIVNSEGRLQAVRIASTKPKEVWGKVICLINSKP